MGHLSRKELGFLPHGSVTRDVGKTGLASVQACLRVFFLQGVESMIDYGQIKQLAKETGQRVTDLIVLAPQNDPFYTGTPNDCALAEWFAGLWHAFSYSSGVHIRRVHYQIVSQKPPVLLPNGTPYENTVESWDMLNLASKAARYLGLVDPASFHDRRNPDPVVYASHEVYEPEV